MTFEQAVKNHYTWLQDLTDENRWTGTDSKYVSTEGI
jgi:hypothetical protein